MWSDAFITQARSDWEIYQELKDNYSQCHELHYLQMTTEKLSKAALAAPPKSHQVFLKFLRSTLHNSRIRNELAENPNQYRAIINEILPIAQKIEQLAPAYDGVASNSEYPWMQPDGSVASPSTHNFPIWDELKTVSGRKLLNLISELVDKFEKFY
jgi:hypothetical protein